MLDNFDFKLIGGEQKPFLGYVSTPDKTAISERVMVRGSKNVYKKRSGTVAVRPGQKRRGSADSTAAGVNASFEWESSLGRIYPLRVANGKLQFESDVVTSDTYVWYDLMTSLSLTRFVFDPWWNNTLKKDQLLFVKGDTNLHKWSGGVGLISSTTINTIVLTAAAASSGFETSGSLLINGNSYTYTGISSSTLTGVSGDPTGEANGSVVIQAVTTTATTPASTFTNDFIKVIGNRLHVGSYTSRLIYISDDSDYTSFSVPATRAPGDPELLTLDSAAKGIGVRKGMAHIGAGTSDWYEVSYSPLTVGSTLTEQTKIDKKPVGNLLAPLAHEFIDNVGDDLVYVDQDNQLRVYGIFRNISQPKYPSLSLAIEDELRDEDFTGGHLRAVSEFIYVTAPLSGRVYFHQTEQSVDSQGNITQERYWHPPQVWNLTRIAVIEGITYGHSNANPQIYQLWNTNQWHDDSPADESLPYDAVMRMSYRNHGRRQGMINFDKVYFEGYLSEGTELDAYVLSDYQGSESVQNPNINSIDAPATFFSGNTAPSIGDSSIGDNPLGDGLTEDSNDQELLPKFRVITDITPVNCFEYQLVVYSENADSRWEILSLGTNAEVTKTEQATFIRK